METSEQIHNRLVQRIDALYEDQQEYFQTSLSKRLKSIQAGKLDSPPEIQLLFLEFMNEVTLPVLLEVLHQTRDMMLTAIAEELEQLQR